MSIEAVCVRERERVSQLLFRSHFKNDIPGLYVCVSSPPSPALPLSDINQTVRIVLYSLIFLLSVLGNSLIIAVLVRNRRMRTVTNLFLLSLSVSDLMVSLVCIPFTLIPNLMRDFIFGTGICKLVMYFMGEWIYDVTVRL